MNKLIKLLLVSAICLSCSTKNNLELNSMIVNEGKADTTFILIPNGALIKSYNIIEKNIEYTLGISSDDKIIYILTTDIKFIINDLRINSTLPESFFDKDWGYRPGWGYFTELESGWFAGFDFQTKPNKESKIQWFFKFDFNKQM